MDSDNNIINTWKSVSVASRELKISRCHISHVCTGRRKTAGGYKWKYAIKK